MPGAQNAQASKQNQAKKPEPANLAHEQAPQAAPEAAFLSQLSADAAAAPGDPPAQAALLQDARLGRAQRQALAAQVRQVGGNQFLQRAMASPGVVQREDGEEEGEEAASVQDRLREAMEGVGTDEEAIFSITAGANAAEKAAILADAGLMAELRDELDSEDLLRVLNNLGAPLADKLRLTMEGAGTDEEALIGMISAASEGDKQAVLNDSGLMAEIKDELSGAELLQALTLLGAPVIDRLRVAMEGAGTDEAAIFEILGAASDAEKAEILADTGLMAEITDELSGEELLRALDLLGAPLADKLRAAMAGAGTDEAAVYAMLEAASDAEKTEVLGDAGLMAEIQDDFSGEELLRVLQILGAPLADLLDVAMTGVGTDEAMIQTVLTNASEADRNAALADAAILAKLFDELSVADMLTILKGAGVPFKRIIELAIDPWAASMSDLQEFITNASDAECQTVWSDTTLMEQAHTHFGESSYLDFVVALRMFQPGTTAEDNATHTSAADADEAIRTHLEAYVQGAVEEGRQITGMVAVVDDADWNVAGIHRYGESVWNGGKKDDINGFVDLEGRVWIHRNRGNAGTMIHEAIHKYSTDAVINVSQPLNEGITEYFTRQVCAALTPPITGRGNYAPNYSATQRLVAVTAEATVAAAYFDGAIGALETAVVNAKSQTAWDNFIAHTASQDWPDAETDLA